MANLLNRIKLIKERRGTAIAENWQIKISGIVQGVGFRPFVYRLASLYRVCGTVKNIDGDVLIDAQGIIKDLISFVNHILERPPQPARIKDVQIEKIQQIPNTNEFVILPSQSNPKTHKQVIFPAPDIAICPDCKNELFEPGNRRYLHPFISCTDCGPRFSVNLEIPFDRRRTTMSVFQLCDLCNEEYVSPLDRRFHSQTNCCYHCGPALSTHSIYHPDLCIEKMTGENITRINEVCQLLQNDGIILLKGISGYHLVCKATSSRATNKIRQMKARPKKPLAVMVKDLGDAYEIADIEPEERRLLTSPGAPIVLLRQKKGTDLSLLLAPGSNKIGVMLAYSPMHQILLNYINEPLVMTSGNLKDYPIEFLNEQSNKIFAKKVDAIIDHNRKIQNPCDDSVVQVVSKQTVFIRRARGFVPEGIELDFISPPMLGCGGDMKSTFCLASDKTAYMGQFTGNLDSWHNFNRYVENIYRMASLLNIRPEFVVHDMHPNYRSTQFALSKYSGKTVAVQHHHAHIVACMLEKHINENVIGIAFDGAGWGIDKKVWGGEFLVCDRERFNRAAHLRYMPMPGGDKCTKLPYRMAAAAACEISDKSVAGKIMEMVQIPEYELSFLEKQIRSGLNTPYTSSIGRLFDIIAAITEISKTVSFEGEAAIELEEIAIEPHETEYYEFVIDDRYGEKIIDWEAVLSEVVKDMETGVTVGEISAKFHNSIVRLIERLSLELSYKYNINKVVLSGGVFQNKLLLEKALKLLSKSGLEVYISNILPINDNGIAAGQIGIANAMIAAKNKKMCA